MAIVVLLFAVLLLLMIRTIVPKVKTEEVGPKFVPTIVAAALMILSLIQLIISVITFRKEKALIKSGVIEETGKESDLAEGTDKWQTICSRYGHIIVWCVMAVCVFFMSQIGFIISASIIMFVTMYMMAPAEEQRPVRFLIISVAVTVGLYFVFVRFFNLMLPVGNIWKSMGIL